MRIENLGCVGPEGLVIELDDILCLVGLNNAGKSTVLEAYELAVGGRKFTADHLCNRSGDTPSAVEIEVHIPDGTPNIAPKWFDRKDGLNIVKSRWAWNGGQAERTTWDPSERQWAADGKAGGVDAVFKSRLPKPFRVGALQSPDEEHNKLLGLVIDPLVDRLQEHLGDKESALAKAVEAVRAAAKAPVAEINERIDRIRSVVNESVRKVFPNITIQLAVGVDDIGFEPKKALLNGSRFKVLDRYDGDERSGSAAEDRSLPWGRQGTGGQRALFWSMLQVRSELMAEVSANRAGRSKRSVGSRGRGKAEAKGAGTSLPALDAQDPARNTEAAPHAESTPTDDGVRLPGYMLLIDEPETALHPNAIRAASTALYELAASEGWQVMLSTHSPVFIDPIADHTTIVRLERSQAHPSPKTFRATNPKFSEDELKNLKFLLQFDTALAEMFFGGLPVLVEGDTEYAAFQAVVQQNPDRFSAERTPLVIRARGKAVLPTLVKMLTHFRVPRFAVLHDADGPYSRDGKVNPAWTVNRTINEAISAARGAGLTIVHRVSLPDFERHHRSIEVYHEKPTAMWRVVRDDEAVAASVAELLEELVSDDATQEAFQGDFMTDLERVVTEWAAGNAPDDARYAVRPATRVT